jgi:hypothetical protein
LGYFVSKNKVPTDTLLTETKYQNVLCFRFLLETLVGIFLYSENTYTVVHIFIVAKTALKAARRKRSEYVIYTKGHEVHKNRF